jgi:hypothetical protein
VRKIILIVVVFLLFFLSTTLSKAESLGYNKAHLDYIYNLDIYKKSHDEYELARGNYLQSKTLASQEKAQSTTAQMLQDRDQVVINYLTALRAKLADTPGLDDSQKQTYYSQLDDQVVWYRNHKTTLLSNASLASLTASSNDAAQKYKDTQIIIYKALSIIENGKLNDYENQMLQIVDELKPKFAEIKTDGEKDTTSMERGVDDVKSKIDQSNQKEDKAWEGLAKIVATDTNQKGLFDSSDKLFLEGLQLLKEANGILNQIIQNIKVK